MGRSCWRATAPRVSPSAVSTPGTLRARRAPPRATSPIRSPIRRAAAGELLASSRVNAACARPKDATHSAPRSPAASWTTATFSNSPSYASSDAVPPRLALSTMRSLRSLIRPTAASAPPVAERLAPVVAAIACCSFPVPSAGTLRPRLEGTPLGSTRSSLRDSAVYRVAIAAAVRGVDREPLGALADDELAGTLERLAGGARAARPRARAGRGGPAPEPPAQALAVGGHLGVGTEAGAVEEVAVTSLAALVTRAAHPTAPVGVSSSAPGRRSASRRLRRR